MVADAAFEVGEDGEGRPRHGNVTKGFLALDGAFDFATGFIVPVQLEQFVCDVAAPDPF